MIYPLPNFNGSAVGVLKWISNFTYTELSMLGLKLTHINKRRTRSPKLSCCIDCVTLEIIGRIMNSLYRTYALLLLHNW